MASVGTHIDTAGGAFCGPDCTDFLEKYGGFWEEKRKQPVALLETGSRDDYFARIDSKARNMVRKADRLYEYHEFDHNKRLDDLYAINTSKTVRQGRPMTASYRQRPEPISRPWRTCTRHRSAWYGGFTRPASFPRENADLIWAAGLFDGDGTATISRNRRRLAVKMADEESVRRFHTAVGVGKVYGPYGHEKAEQRDGSSRRPSFMWLAETEDADTVARLLLPNVSTEKREQIHRVCPGVPTPPVEPGGKLVVYCNLIILGDLGIVNRVLSHAEAAAAMNGMFAFLVEAAPVSYLHYLTLASSTEGLTAFKKSVGFKEVTA